MTLLVPRLCAGANFKVDSEDVAAKMNVTEADVAAGRSIGPGQAAHAMQGSFIWVALFQGRA